MEEKKTTYFTDRVDAGKQLAAALSDVENENGIVLAIPRGGVVVGYEIAKALNLPLDVIIPHKIGAPDNPELAIGAMTEDGTIILDRSLVNYLSVPEKYIREESERQKLEIERRLKMYRKNEPYPDLKGRTVIVVDDGIATGSTMKAALASARKKGAKTIIAAAPVCPPSTIKDLEKQADQIICVHSPEYFSAIGEFYDNFDQTTDKEVIELLQRSKQIGGKSVGVVTA